MRTPTGEPLLSQAHRFGRFEIRPSERLLLDDGRAVALGPRAFDLLLALIERHGQLVGKDELLKIVWRGLVVGENNLHTQVSSLRAVLGPDAIATVAGRGYRFAMQLAASPAAPQPASIASAATPVPHTPRPERGDETPLQPSMLRFGAIELYPVERRLVVEGRPAVVGSRAFDVLMALVARDGRVVSKHDLLDLVWPGLVVEENNLTTQISTLRKLLGPESIATIPGFGYKFALDGGARPAGDPPAPPSPPAPAVQAPRSTNVPVIGEALFGRAGAIDTLIEWTLQHRLTTIVGAGGIGKTSVAQTVARARVGDFADGVWWVDLASISDPERIAIAVANAAGVRLAEGDSFAQLVQELASRRMLLVLDNCEHLAGGVARLIDAVLAESGGVRFLATSQEALKAAGERLFRLEGLAIPPLDASLDDARTYGSVQLLEQRALAADRHFELTADNIAKAIGLCRQLDGIALAIEMAASRLPLLGLDALDANLGQRLRLLRTHRRGAPPRQQTLLATLQWSHSLLNADEQVVLRCLGAFAGGFRLEVAQRVCSASTLDEWAVLDAMSGLVDRSILQVEQEEPPRYRLLETTRLFVREQLAEHGDRDAVARQHGLAMAELAREVEDSYWVTPDAPWLERFAPDYADLELAFDRACAQGDAAIAAATLEALFRLDHLRAMLPSIPPLLASAAALLPSVTEPLDRARLLLRLSFPSYSVVIEGLSRLAASRACVEQFSVLDDRRRRYQALLHLAENLGSSGAADEAEQAMTAARALEAPDWPPRLRWLGAHSQSRVCAYAGDSQGYRSSTRAALECAERAGSPCQTANARLNLADAALMAGDWDESIALGRAAVAEVAALGLSSLSAVALLNLVAAYLRKGDAAAALRTAAQALPVAWKMKFAGYLSAHLALLAATLDRFEAAARMTGFAETWMSERQHVFEPSEVLSLRLARELGVASFGDERWEALRAGGASLDEDQAHRLVQSMLDGGDGQHAEVPTSAPPLRRARR